MLTFPYSVCTTSNKVSICSLLIANKNSRLVAIHQGKYYRRSDGLALGPGAFIKGLEYAASIRSVLIGKPNEYFFRSAIPEGICPEECVMIGDVSTMFFCGNVFLTIFVYFLMLLQDPNDDIVGAMQLGLKGIQVKTGKYLPNVVTPPPTALVENFSEAVNWIITKNSEAQ